MRLYWQGLWQLTLIVLGGAMLWLAVQVMRADAQAEARAGTVGAEPPPEHLAVARDHLAVCPKCRAKFPTPRALLDPTAGCMD